jgi:hypothetical protein
MLELNSFVFEVGHLIVMSNLFSTRVGFIRIDKKLSKFIYLSFLSIQNDSFMVR